MALRFLSVRISTSLVLPLTLELARGGRQTFDCRSLSLSLFLLSSRERARAAFHSSEELVNGQTDGRTDRGEGAHGGGRNNAGVCARERVVEGLKDF